MEQSHELLQVFYEHLSLRDAASLAQVNRDSIAEFRRYLRRKRYDDLGLRRVRGCFEIWRKAPPRRPRLAYTNSWARRAKDPERPILLF